MYRELFQKADVEKIPLPTLKICTAFEFTGFTLAPYDHLISVEKKQISFLASADHQMLNRTSRLVDQNCGATGPMICVCSIQAGLVRGCEPVRTLNPAVVLSFMVLSP